jgi:hypothetical protein
MAITPVYAPIADGPIIHGAAIVPSDVTVFAPTRKVWVGGAGGTLTVLFNGDSSTTLLSGIPVGTMLDISITKVMATGTAATLIIGLS